MDHAMRRLTLACLLGSLLFALPALAAGPANRNLAITASQPQQMKSEQRLALVIGNGNYAKGSLGQNPLNDAKDMGAALERMGFQVILLTDAGKSQMKEAVYRFGEQLKNGGVGLFFYAGHGVQIRDQNYLLPVDARIRNESEVEDESIGLNRVMQAMDNARNRLNIVLLDACRDNPFTMQGSFRSTRAGFSKVEVGDSATGMVIAFATAPGKTAANGNSRNGLWTSALLNAMNGNDTRIESVLKAARGTVRQKSGGAQVPWDASSLEGDFWFNRAQIQGAATAGSATAAGTPAPVPRGTLQSIELPSGLTLADWVGMNRDATSATVIEEALGYLDKYGAFPELVAIAARGVGSNLKSLPLRGAGDARALVDKSRPALRRPALAPDAARIVTDRLLLLATPEREALATAAVLRDWRQAAAAQLDDRQRLALLRREAMVCHGGAQFDCAASAYKAWLKEAGASHPERPQVAQDLLRANQHEVMIGGVVAGASFSDCAGCPELVAVPAGRFTMGVPPPAIPRSKLRESKFRESPAREVTIAAFAIGRFEVTFAQWDECVAGGGCNGHTPYDSGWGRGNRPVVDISWDEARQYLQWLSKKSGKRYRLPSEAEWEYAARAGTTTRFHTGDCITTAQANFDDRNTQAIPVPGCPRSGMARGQTSPVGSFAANAFGLHDMHGNVEEWVQDCRHIDYQGAPLDGSAREDNDCFRRMVRGGSWDQGSQALRSQDRSIDLPSNTRAPTLGFRVARDLE